MLCETQTDELKQQHFKIRILYSHRANLKFVEIAEEFRLYRENNNTAEETSTKQQAASSEIIPHSKRIKSVCCMHVVQRVRKSAQQHNHSEKPQ